ncbi:hypothetical protein N3K66_005902 [Trichothecium roseum]|uniref:Uncharacterized protein n=1 Tax=Trichothecium roseum TaxID=47278 RepID=A0ACC0UZQ6_9HYPO|nr:hypothetical protein N3K66_005902 [Trichothecium roseum]
MRASSSYTVGWICATLPEFVAAQEFLDEEHDGPSHVASGDKNSYCLGRIHKHNIAIAALPDGRYGTSTAAAVATSMLHSFPNIRIGLMVGIAGGAPTADDDIRLGDIVVSAPRGDNSGVFQYNFGKTIQGREFLCTRHLDKPPTAVLTAVSTLRAKHERRGHGIEAAVQQRVTKMKRGRKYSRPDASTDVLYRSEVIHADDEQNCAKLEKTVSETIKLVQHDVHEIKQIMASNKKTAEDNKVMKWLRAAHPSNKRNAVEQRRYPGSGRWLMDDTRYKTWKCTPGSFLWLSGMAGCGKTFLSSAVVDDIQRSGLRVIYFYFQFDDDTRQTVDHLLRSLICQSYWTSEKAKAHIKDVIQGYDRHIQPNSTQLYDCLVSILNSDEYWVIIDALDECPDKKGSHAEGVLQFIKSLRADTEEHIHVLVTSRAEQNISDSISQWAVETDAIQLNQGLVGQDIESYVNYQLVTRKGFIHEVG